MSSQSPATEPDTLTPSPEDAVPGVAERWAIYTQIALTRIIIVPTILSDKPTAVHLVAQAPGFDGWILPLDSQEDLLAQIITGLEDWLEYRLANWLSIPLLPGIETPSLEDFEEYDAIRAYDQAKAAQEEPIPMDEAFAMLDSMEH